MIRSVAQPARRRTKVAGHFEENQTLRGTPDMRSLKNWTLMVSLIASSFAFAPKAGPTVEHGFDVANMDRTTSACVNFFQFSNGGWMAHNEIPAAYPAWGNANELQERNRDVLHQILEDAAKNTNATPGSNE